MQTSVGGLLQAEGAARQEHAGSVQGTPARPPRQGHGGDWRTGDVRKINGDGVQGVTGQAGGLQPTWAFPLRGRSPREGSGRRWDMVWLIVIGSRAGHEEWSGAGGRGGAQEERGGGRLLRSPRLLLRNPR